MQVRRRAAPFEFTQMGSSAYGAAMGALIIYGSAAAGAALLGASLLPERFNTWLIKGTICCATGAPPCAPSPGATRLHSIACRKLTRSRSGYVVLYYSRRFLLPGTMVTSYDKYNAANQEVAHDRSSYLSLLPPEVWGMV